MVISMMLELDSLNFTGIQFSECQVNSSSLICKISILILQIKPKQNSLALMILKEGYK